MATVTFLFSDIAGSTRLWEKHPEAMAVALARHDQLIREMVEFHGGQVFKHTGDGAVAAFDSAPRALRAGAEIQRVMANTIHPEIGPLNLRMAVHTGEAEERGGDFFGPPLNRAARLLSAAHPGQVLVSMVTERLVVGSAYERIALRDLGEYRLRDLTRRERIYQLESEGLESDFPPLLTPDRTPNNLPTLPTSFVGRDQEQAEVIKLIRGARVVTITGPGGVGKTRLAFQVAAAVTDEFPGGIWLVALGALTNPDLIYAAAGEALGVAQERSRSIRESVIAHLAGLEGLLILDNCEHMILGAAEFVSEVISTNAECRIITTSRELLGVEGEVPYGLRSMQMPVDGTA